MPRTQTAPSNVPTSVIWKNITLGVHNSRIDFFSGVENKHFLGCFGVFFYCKMKLMLLMQFKTFVENKRRYFAKCAVAKGGTKSLFSKSQVCLKYLHASLEVSPESRQSIPSLVQILKFKL